ncbi:MAG: SpoIIE family protein phosphatase [Anaerolineae bacterium]|jgi:sigma-B regulation protein RsbU (phosphoserine phosphatase)|nr:SpoIIE family protein phosphatase [Anaerolineae bacterium]
MAHPSPSDLPAERLALLARLAQQFNSSLDLDEVLNRVMDEVIAAVRAERGFVMLREVDGALSFRVARGMDQRTIDEPGFQVSRGVIEQVAAEGRAVLSSDAQHDDRFSMRQSIVSLGLRSILAAPLIVRDRVIGVIYVDSRLQAGIFTLADLELLTAIASSAAIAVENARLYRAAVEKGRLEREFQMARELQAGLVTRAAPEFVGWDLAAHWQPAREVAGDFFDFIKLSGNRLGALVADVADKGMPAALFMALCRSILRASLVAAASPAEGIAAANRLICEDAANGMFVTLFYAELHADGSLTYVNAGHNPALLRSALTGAVEELAPTGPLLGFDESAQYTQRTLHLREGDFALLYTDGVTEAICDCAEDACFGEERLRRLVADAGAGAAHTALARLTAAVAEFAGPTPPFDDVTAVGIKRVS